jgi:sialate O-acetylesterase
MIPGTFCTRLAGKLILLFAAGWLVTPDSRAELKLPAVIGDHMVLQQGQPDLIWGWDSPGLEIKVSFATQTLSTKVDSDGRWSVKLAPLIANATPQAMTISGSSRREIRDVLVGEVWMCSGQSNMGFKLADDWNGDLAAAEADFPNIRLISVPHVGTQQIQDDFKGRWQRSTPETARQFSAVGFLFGRHLHQILKVPVGLVDNSWGGSSAEAWVRRSALESDGRFQALLDSARKRETELLPDEGKAELDRLMAEWRKECLRVGTVNPPWPPENWLLGRYRPGNIFAGVLNPMRGYGIKGVIWYQGEANAGRAFEYASLFPFLIEQWRREWGQGDFPFYWVQLANYGARAEAPKESAWAELRQAQTGAMQLPNTGQAVIIDLGEGKDIHPRNKHDVAARLVRWALAKDYGMKLPYRSPEFETLTINGDKAVIIFNCFGSRLRPFGTEDVRGFAVCGVDRVWHWATGTLVGPAKIEVCSKSVPCPVAVRYGWADDPVCNLFSNDGLPVTPFRTDDFEMLTKPKSLSDPVAK